MAAGDSMLGRLAERLNVDEGFSFLQSSGADLPDAVPRSARGEHLRSDWRNEGVYSMSRGGTDSSYAMGADTGKPAVSGMDRRADLGLDFTHAEHDADTARLEGILNADHPREGGRIRVERLQPAVRPGELSHGDEPDALRSAGGLGSGRRVVIGLEAAFGKKVEFFRTRVLRKR